ncbi:centrosomal protein 43 [Rhinoderma darwinii]|uniref:centrosomal protein 43 n=1 Tax=Rhinoderma darwinii TaxID=43563 RepID=UPI003F664C5A
MAEMSAAAEEDTELRDLLIHTLENNGVLNKIKAELRASVFLALEEQERAENKPSLLNENLRQFLATRDGRLVVGLLTDFLQHFHLDFTLAVLQPEACLPSVPDDRTSTARELGLPVSEAGRKAPLLLELVRLFQPRDAARALPQELLPEHIAEAQAKFKQYYRESNGEIGEKELRTLFVDLCPNFHRNMLDRYVTDELAAAGRDLGGGIDEPRFLAMFRRLFMQCRSVVARDLLSSTPLHDGRSRTEGDTSSSKIISHMQPTRREVPQLDHEDSKLDDDDLEGDSFFDDPKPEKTYGWKETSKPNGVHPVPSHSSFSGSPKVSDPDLLKEKMASLELGAGHEEDYMDDFQSSSQRSEKSELSIGEDLEEELSVDELTASDHKLEDFTLDNSISHLSDVADYLEDVS